MKSLVYRGLSLSNDLKALSKGPSPVAKRIVRKAAYRGLSRFLNRALR